MALLDTMPPMPSAGALPAPADRAGQAASGLLARLARRCRMHHALFVAFTAISAVPVLGLASWVEHTAVERELSAVHEKHLLVARNLTSALERYAVDAEAVFQLAIASGRAGTMPAGMPELLASLHFHHVCLVAPDGTVTSYFAAKDAPPIKLGDLKNVLAERAAAADGRVIFSDLMPFGGRPAIFLLQRLAGGFTAIGAITTEYPLELQKAIAFGDKGHATILDRAGRVMAHPFAHWVSGMLDLSKLGVVQAMMRGETGVANFYSPAMKADMVAGYTSVPRTGWGVMVPQPVSELYAKASGVQQMATTLSLIGLAVAALLSWFLAKWLTRPVASVAAVARVIAGGNRAARASETGGFEPAEARELALSFNIMVEELERKNTELAEAAREARAADRAKTEFLASMSHELRTPLNAVIGFSEVMQAEAFGPLGADAYKGYATDIHSSGKHLLGIINDVLDLAKAEAGKLELSEEVIDLNQVVDGAVRLVQQRAQAAGLSLSVRLPETALPAVRGEERKLKQILINLLSNAVKFTPEGGRIELAVAADPRGGLSFRVTDTGIGIPAADQERVFQPFVQVDGSLARKYEGTGLGLPLVKAMAERHGGTVRLDSREGRGTTVTVTLPAERLAA